MNLRPMIAAALKATLAAGMLLVVAPAGYSAPIDFTATLTGPAENPPVASPATGFADVTVTGDMLHVNETFSDLVAPATAAHIHCCTPPGTNTIVAVPFGGFPNTTSGTYTFDFDLTNTATYSSSFLTAGGGTAAGAEALLLAGLEGGEAYVNIHDAVFPAGEIRGFLQQQFVPEPATLALLGLAFAGIGFARRRNLH